MSETSKARTLYELTKKPTDPPWTDLPWYAHTVGQENKTKWINAIKVLLT